MSKDPIHNNIDPKGGAPVEGEGGLSFAQDLVKQALDQVLGKQTSSSQGLSGGSAPKPTEQNRKIQEQKRQEAVAEIYRQMNVSAQEERSNAEGPSRTLNRLVEGHRVKEGEEKDDKQADKSKPNVAGPKLATQDVKLVKQQTPLAKTQTPTSSWAQKLMEAIPGTKLFMEAASKLLGFKMPGTPAEAPAKIAQPQIVAQKPAVPNAPQANKALAPKGPEALSETETAGTKLLVCSSEAEAKSAPEQKLARDAVVQFAALVSSKEQKAELKSKSENGKTKTVADLRRGGGNKDDSLAETFTRRSRYTIRA